MVKVPDAYTAVEELGEQALIRSKYKHEQADSSSIEEVDENIFEFRCMKMRCLAEFLPI